VCITTPIARASAKYPGHLWITWAQQFQK